jgi:hypothetical protein
VKAEEAEPKESKSEVKSPDGEAKEEDKTPKQELHQDNADEVKEVVETNT